LTNNMGEQRLGGDQGFFWGGGAALRGEGVSKASAHSLV
jgi:hypothetical protein